MLKNILFSIYRRANQLVGDIPPLSTAAITWFLNYYYYYLFIFDLTI